MPTYQVIPHAEFGRGFHLEVDHERVARLVEVTRDDFEIHVGDRRYRIDSSSFSGTRFQVVDEEGRVLATAERPVAISPRYEVRGPGGVSCEIQPVSTFGRKHHVLMDQTIVGVVDPDNITTRTTVTELPEKIDVTVAVLLTWLVQRSDK